MIRRVIYTTLVLLAYLLMVYLCETYFKDSFITLVISIPFTLSFAIGYGAGDTVGDVLHLGVIILIWLLIYFFLTLIYSYHSNKGTIDTQNRKNH